MAGFDPTEYFRQRAQAAQSGLSSFSAGMDEKSQAKADAVAKRVAEIRAEKEQHDGSLIGFLGVDADSAAGFVGNSIASGQASGVREAGNIATAPISMYAKSQEAGITPEQMAAYQRFKADAENINTPDYVNQSSDEDIAILNSPYKDPVSKAPTSPFSFKDDSPKYGRFSYDNADEQPELEGARGDGLLVLDRIKSAEDARNLVETVDDATESFANTWVSQVNRNRLNEAAEGGGEAFAGAFDGLKKVVAGEEGGAQQFGDQMMKGLGITANAMKEWRGISEYIAETGAQLAIGALPGGLMAQTVGYAIDAEEEGNRKYREENNGQMPPPEVQAEITRAAFAAGALNYAGNAALLGNVGKSIAAKAGKNLGDSVVARAARTGAATTSGGTTEGITEAAQTYFEGEAALKPSTSQEIFLGGFIGTAAGGGLAGGMRAGAEATGSTEEQVEIARDKAVENARETKAAAEEAAVIGDTGEVGELGDPTSIKFSPVTAVKELDRWATQEGRTPEEAATAQKKTDEIVTGLTDLIEANENTLRLTTEEGRTAYEAEIQQMEEAEPEIAAIMRDEVKQAQKMSPKDIKRTQATVDRDRQRLESVESFRTRVDEIRTTPEQSQEAAEPVIEQAVKGDQEASSKIVVMAMRNPESMSIEQLDQIVASDSVPIKPAEREYLRNLSASRQAENALKTTDSVRSNIIKGGNGYVGMNQYRQRVAAALRSENSKAAETQVSRLERFATQHKSKYTAAQAALNEVAGTKNTINLVFDEQRGWQRVDRKVTKAERAANAGMTIHRNSANFVGKIRDEVPVVEAAARELRSAVSISDGSFVETAPVEAGPEVETAPATEGTAEPAETAATEEVVEEAPAVSEPTPEPVSEPAPEPVAEETVDANETVATEPTAGPAPENEEVAEAVTEPEVTAESEVTPEVVSSVDSTVAPVEASTDSSVAPVVSEPAADVSVTTEPAPDAQSAENPTAKAEVVPIASLEGKPVGRMSLDYDSEAQATVPKIRMLSSLTRDPEAAVATVSTALETLQAARPSTRIQSEATLSGPMAAAWAGLEYDGKARKLDNGRYQMLSKSAAPFSQPTPAVENSTAPTETAAQDVAPAAPTTSSTTEAAPTAASTEAAGSTAVPVDDGVDANPGASPVVDPEAEPDVVAGEDTSPAPERVRKATKPSLLRKLAKAASTAAGTMKTETFKKANLIAEYMTQREGRGRPLSEEGDFLADLFNDVTLANDYLDTPMDADQTQFIMDVVDASLELDDALANTLVAPGETGSLSEAFRYTDMIEFLRDENGDLDDNVKNAIMMNALAWVQDTGSAPSYLTDKQLNGMIGLSPDTYVPPDARNQLNSIGVRERLAHNSLGASIVKSLGIRANPDAPANTLTMLEASLGAHAIGMLEAGGYVKRTMKTSRDIRLAYEGSPGAKKQFDPKLDKAKHYFVTVLRNDDGTAVDSVQKIVDSGKGTAGVLTKLLGADTRMTEPSFVPVKLAQENAQNSLMKIPSFLRKTLDKEGEKEHAFNKTMVQAYRNLPRDMLERMAGVVDPETILVHDANVMSLRGKNDALKRELDNLETFMEMAEAQEAGLDTPFFFPRSVWKMQRVGLNSNLMDPLGSKVQRHMIYMKGWETDIDLSKSEDVDRFMLAIADAFDLPTDKQTNAQSLQGVERLMDTDVIKDGVAAMQSSLAGESLSVEQRAAIEAAVSQGGAKFHTLDGLVALAQFRTAQASPGVTTFTTTLMREVDGVTNGPILTQLMLGAARSSVELRKLLEKGGFYGKHSQETQFGAWRSDSANDDLYETLARDIYSSYQGSIQKDQALAKTYNSVQYLTGALFDTKAGKLNRNLVKTPLTAMVFGSSINNTVETMGADLEQKAYDKIQKAANSKGDPATVQREIGLTLAALSNVMKHGGLPNPGIQPNMSVEQALRFKLNTRQRNALVNGFKESMGKDIDDVFSDKFNVFLERRQKVNTAAQTAFELYNAVREDKRQSMIQTLAARGELPKDRHGNVLQDLTKAQEEVLDRQMQEMLPVVHSPLSSASNEMDAGIFLGKRDRNLSVREMYKGIAKFGKGNTSSLRGLETTLENPGVSGLILAMHSTDSAISSRAYSMLNALNVHDAHGLGINNVAEGATNLNHMTLDTLTNYSLPSEMADALERTITSLLKVSGPLKEGSDLSVALQKLDNDTLDSLRERDDSDNIMAEMDRLGVNALGYVLVEAREAAQRADTMKLNALKEMTHVDQYAFEGGNYELQPDDYARIDYRLANIKQISNDTLASMQQLKQTMAGNVQGNVYNADGSISGTNQRAVPEGDTEGQYGTIGESPNEQDMELGEMLSGMNGWPVNSVMKALQARTKNGQYKAMIDLMARVVPDVATFTYLSEGTTAPKNMPNDPSVPAFVYMGGDSGVQMVVRSTDYTTSNVTEEVLVHEMIHAAVNAVLLDNTGPNAPKEIKEIRRGLENLRREAKKVVNSNPELKAEFAYATSDIYELISFGMTNPRFQKEVLAKVKVDPMKHSALTQNRFITGMTRFIEMIAQAVFGKQANVHENGLTALIAYTNGLVGATKAMGYGRDWNGEMTNEQDDVVQKIMGYRPQEIFDALRDPAADPIHARHLESLMTDLVAHVHESGSALKEDAFDAPTAADGFAEALVNGRIPFASRLQASRFEMSDQELYVAEQVEVTMRAAIDGDGALYREMAKLWRETSLAMPSAESFFDGDWSKATPNEQAIAQHQRDFLFKLDPNAKSSEHLARFAALASTNARIRAKMQFDTVRITPSLRGMKIGEALTELVRRAMVFINSRLNKVSEGQRADLKLEKLMQSMADVESRKRQGILSRDAAAIERMDDATHAVQGKIREQLEKFGRTDFFKKSKYGMVRFAGTLTSTVAGQRTEQFAEGIRAFRDKSSKERHGVMMSLFTEVRGAVDAGGRNMQQLFREVTKKNENRRMQLMDVTKRNVMQNFENEGKDLSRDDKKALTYVLLRTGMADLVDKYSMDQLTRFTNDDVALAAEIKNMESDLAQFGSLHQYYQSAARDLALNMVTGQTASDLVTENAHNIAFLGGTSKMGSIPDSQGEAALEVLDPLVSLYALQFSGSLHRQKAGQVMTKELSRGKSNGAEATLRMAKWLQDESLKTLFENQPALMRKGYSSEITDPSVSIKVVPVNEGINLERLGWVLESHVAADKSDPDQRPKAVYTIRDGGSKSYLSGIFSTTSEQASGTALYGAINTRNGVNKANLAKHRKVMAGKQQAVDDLFNRPLSYDPRKQKDLSKPVPIFNNSGEVTGFRHTMTQEKRDVLLKRNNDIESVMGAMAGSLYDKPAAKAQNREAVQAMFDQYKGEFKDRGDSYLEISADSKDLRLQEAWHLLPDDTKKAVREIWGRDAMMVRNDLVDMTFGYRKMSVTELFDPTAENAGVMRSIAANTLGYLINIGRHSSPLDQQDVRTARTVQRLRKAEDMWQEVVKHLKDILVVKNVVTFLGNVASNVSLLAWYGIGPSEMIQSHREATEGLIHYRRDLNERDSLEQMLNVGYVDNAPAVRQRIAELNDLLARSPVNDMIEAGMLPTIVEDVDLQDDPFSYQSLGEEKLKPLTDRVPAPIRTAAKVLYMAHDTTAYKLLSQGTQSSDFIARYTLFKHVTDSKRATPMARDKALQLASDMFINYDIPTHRGLQYMNDMGLLMFTKYYLRIQKTIMHLYQERPGRALALTALSGFLPAIPMLMDSAFWHRMYSPLRGGALEYPGSLGELGTLQLMSAPFGE